MKKWMSNTLLSLLLLITLSLTGCGENPAMQDGKQLLASDWDTIESVAEGSTVRFYMYGGSARINNWVDTYVATRLKELYNITLVRVPMDAGIFVNKLITEKSAGKTIGSMDLLWINGENFKAAKEARTLFGPYADKLPNFIKNIDKGLAANDFGYPVEGYEVPYGKAQFVFEYDMAKTDTPPMSYAELENWVQANPGQFTYPQPPDFTGSAFIRQAFYALTGGADQYMSGWNQELFDKHAPKLWEYLNRIEPYLWQKGKSYPKGVADLDTLFGRGEVAISMSYHPLHAQSKILDKSYPSSVRTYAMQEGAIFNLHFTAIPFNAANKAGAMAVSNFLLSHEAQLSKFIPANWGDFPAIELVTLTPEQRKEFTAVDLGKATMLPDALKQVAVPEIPAEYLEALEKGWEEHVLR